MLTRFAPFITRGFSARKEVRSSRSTAPAVKVISRCVNRARRSPRWPRERLKATELREQMIELRLEGGHALLARGHRLVHLTQAQLHPGQAVFEFDGFGNFVGGAAMGV